jgi:hypothetical protein
MHTGAIPSNSKRVLNRHFQQFKASIQPPFPTISNEHKTYIYNNLGKYKMMNFFSSILTADRTETPGDEASENREQSVGRRRKGSDRDNR